MMEREELKDVLLNYPKLTLSEDLILKYCIFDNPLPIFREGMNNLKIFRYHLFNASEILVPKDNIQIEITPKGLSLNLNINDFLNKLEQFYNIKLIGVDKKEQLKTIKTIREQLRDVTSSKDLKNISPSLKNDYVKYREKSIRDYLGNYERSYIEHMFIQKYVRNQLDNLSLLSECLRFNFYPITSFNNLLVIIDKNKLSLFLAYQIMYRDQKQSTKNTLTYLVEYIKNNQDALKENYKFEKRVYNKLNLIETKEFSTQVIYDYLKNKLEASLQDKDNNKKYIKKRS